MAHFIHRFNAAAAAANMFEEDLSLIEIGLLDEAERLSWALFGHAGPHPQHRRTRFFSEQEMRNFGIAFGCTNIGPPAAASEAAAALAPTGVGLGPGANSESQLQQPGAALIQGQRPRSPTDGAGQDRPTAAVAGAGCGATDPDAHHRNPQVDDNSSDSEVDDRGVNVDGMPADLHIDLDAEFAPQHAAIALLQLQQSAGLQRAISRKASTLRCTAGNSIFTKSQGLNIPVGKFSQAEEHQLYGELVFSCLNAIGGVDYDQLTNRYNAEVMRRRLDDPSGSCKLGLTISK